MRILPYALLVIGCAILCSAMAAAQDGTAGDVVERVKSGAEPLRGQRTLEPEELWRLGGDDEDLLLGAIGQVALGPDGNFYLLDRQTAQVHVISAGGAYLRSLSRQGEGPGETQRPRTILFMSDGTLGIVESMPGRIVRLSLDGIPAEDITPGERGTGQGFRLLWNAVARGGNLVGCIESMQPGQGTFQRLRSLERIGQDGAKLAIYLEASHEQDMANFKLNEAEDYFVHRGGFALGPDGRVYAAPKRDRYLIHVYSVDGDLERTIERDFVRIKRTAEERERANAGMQMVIHGREIEKEIAEYDQCIVGLRVDEEGRIWVTHSGSSRDLPEGVLLTYDVFDPQGRYDQRVSVACEGSAETDRIFFVGPERAVLVRGASDTMIARMGPGGGGGGGAELTDVPIEVICYRVAS